MSEGKESPHFRLFVAIRLPEEIRKTLSVIQADLQSMLAADSVTWTKTDQLHLTLKFLGNVPVEQIDALLCQLGRACLEFSPVLIRAEGLGAFPDLRFPRVIWVGLNDANGKLAQIHASIEIASRQFASKEPDKRFSAHVTIGRPKRLNAKDRGSLEQMLSKMSDQCFGEWMASDVELMRSQLSSQGALHTTLQTFSFQ